MRLGFKRLACAAVAATFAFGCAVRTPRNLADSVRHW